MRYSENEINSIVKAEDIGMILMTGEKAVEAASKMMLASNNNEFPKKYTAIKDEVTPEWVDKYSLDNDSMTIICVERASFNLMRSTINKCGGKRVLLIEAVERADGYIDMIPVGLIIMEEPCIRVVERDLSTDEIKYK